MTLKEIYRGQWEASDNNFYCDGCLTLSDSDQSVHHLIFNDREDRTLHFCGHCWKQIKEQVNFETPT